MHALALALSTLAAQPDATPGPTGPQPQPPVTSEPGPTAEPPPQAPPATATAEPQPIAEPPPAPPAQTPAQAPAAATTAEPRPRWWGPFPRPKVSGYGGPALRLSGLHGGGVDVHGVNLRLQRADRGSVRFEGLAFDGRQCAACGVGRLDKRRRAPDDGILLVNEALAFGEQFLITVH